MRYQFNVAALAAATGIASAFPLQSRGQTFSVDQVGTGRFITRNGPGSYMRSLKKFNMEVPSGVVAAAASGTTGTVANTPGVNDEQYLIPVQIGTNGQTLNLDFDSGSSDLWVFSRETTGSTTSGHNLYDPSASGQLQQGETWDITYGDGSGASGNVYADTVAIGGVSVTNQAVEAAQTVSADEFDSTDGLIGFAQSSINTVTPNKALTWFDNVGPNLASNLFTATLKHGTPGSYDFGYIDDSKHTGSITYAPVDFSQGFWQFTVDGYSVGSGSGNGGSSFTAIADTGTSIILIDDQVVQDYYSQVSSAQNNPNDGGYVYDCSEDLPDFQLTISGQQFTVPGSTINYAQNSDGTCYGGIQSNQGLGLTILGDTFLKSVFAVFDQGNTQIGFAPQA